MSREKMMMDRLGKREQWCSTKGANCERGREKGNRDENSEFRRVERYLGLDHAGECGQAIGRKYEEAPEREARQGLGREPP